MAGVVHDLDRLPDAVQAEGAQRAVRSGRVADGALAERHAELIGHRQAPPPAGSMAGR